MLNRDKKAVSPIIGYVLLIVGLLAVSAIVYSWLQTYVPKASAECPADVSIYVKDINCTIENGDVELRLSLKNNGLFDVDGFFIHATNSSEQTLAAIDLVQYLPGRSADSQIELFNEGREPLKDGESRGYIFNVTALNNITTIEIIPAKFEIVDRKKRFTSCGSSKITEIVNCKSVTSSP